MSKKAKIAKTGEIVHVISVSGGWTSVRKQDNTEVKVRNSALEELSDFEKAAVGGKTAAKSSAKAPGKTAKADKPAKVKAEKPAKPPKVKAKVDGEEAPSKLVNPDYDRYTKHDIKSPSGRKALDVGDEAAELLRGQDISDCYFIVAKNIAKAEGRNPDEVEAELKDRYKALNVGMQRMNLGNRLRKALGTYGNRNAHKTVPVKAKADPQPESKPDAKYGKRAGETLKRASDRAAA